MGISPRACLKLGLVEDVNRANAEANDRTYRANAPRPRLRRSEEAINTRVLPASPGRRPACLTWSSLTPWGGPRVEPSPPGGGPLPGALTTPNEHRDRIWPRPHPRAWGQALTCP